MGSRTRLVKEVDMGLQTITGLWRSDKGHLSAKTNREIVIPEGRRVFVFKNKNRRNDRDPEYNLVISDGQDERQQGAYQRPAADAAADSDPF